MNIHLNSILQQAIKYTERANYNQARSLLSYVLNVQPKNFEALYTMGFIYGIEGNHKEASYYSLRALKIKPDNFDVILNCAKALQEMGSHLESIKYYQKAIFLSPNNHEIRLGCGKSLHSLERFDEAISHYDYALNLKPDYAEGWLNKGWALHGLKRYEEAIAHYDNALNLKPDFAQAYYNKGVSFNELQQHDQALAQYDNALKFNSKFAEAWSNRAQTNLFIKRYQAGWGSYDWRLKTAGFQLQMAVEGLPLWNGSNCEHLLVFSEQGIGDIIFYASIIGVANKRVKSISFSIDARLLPILSRSFPDVTFIDKNELLDASLYDAQIPFSSLPVILNMQPDMEGRRVPYLFANNEITRSLEKNYSSKKRLKCGIAWKSNNNKIGKDKSILLSDLHDVFKLDEYEFITLQYGDTQEEIQALKKNSSAQLMAIEGMNLFENIDGLLSIIQTCDYIITTSNVTAHLAGALGKTTFLLVPYSVGRIWYWHNEAISSWYPSIFLYSQSKNLEWGDAIKAIAQRLKNETY